MKAIRFLPVVPIAILLVGFARPAAADLCAKCQGMAFIQSIGECSSCDGHTSSGAFKLCKKCSAEQGKCEHCLASLDSGKKPPKPINPNAAGKYQYDKWRYSLEIRSPGTRSEGKWGKLFYGNKELPGAEINDHYRTPWGPIYWVGLPKTRWGEHGWFPRPSRSEKRKGKLLPSPEGKLLLLELTSADNGKTIKTVVGTTLVISLEGNITTGYSWHTADLSGETLKPMGKPEYVAKPHGPGMVGAGGAFLFKFAAVKPGKATVKLAYARPWEKGKPPEKSLSITVEVRTEKGRPPSGRGKTTKPPGVGATRKK